MRVSILTSGRFHVLDLARELTHRGHELRFYSLVPPWRTRRFGLPLRANRWLGAALGPLYLAHRGLVRAESSLTEYSSQALVEALDRTTAAILEPCDVFIGMSGMCLKSLKKARSLGAFTILERGSMHIEAQRDILDQRHPGGPTSIPDRVVRRERAEYAEADFISIPSLHAEESFVARGHARDRIFRNPYGVSLGDFPLTPEPDRPRLLIVGTWCWRKGVDVLVDAFARLKSHPEHADLELVHVGAVGDVPLPEIPGFRHVDPVPQHELSRYYAEASVLILPSREDGFGMVLCQGLASGLPIVCSTHTGGPDLSAFVTSQDAVHLVPPNDPATLAEALGKALATCASPGQARKSLAPDLRERLSWKAYGERWDAFLRSLPRPGSLGR